MSSLRRFVDKIKPPFEKGGKLHPLLALFEAIESFLFVPNRTTVGRVHIRDANDMKRSLIIVLIAMVPALLFGMWNTGFHHFQALGMEVVVFATINLTSTGRQNLIEFERDIVQYPEVIECYTMTGIWDYMLKIVTKDIRHYEKFARNTLTTSPSIRELHSHMAVTEIKNSTELPLDTQL